MSSILNDIKHALGIPADNTEFDQDIILFTNGVLSTLSQLGVGPAVGYQITDENNQWAEFFTDPRLNSAKSFIFLKAKLAFDPPDMGAVITSMENQLEELTYRLHVVANYG